MLNAGTWRDSARLLRAIRSRLGPLWWHTGLMFVFSRIGDVINLYVGMFMVPDRISADQLGAVIPILRLTTLVGVPLGILGVVATKFVNGMLVRGESGRIKAFLRDFARLAGGMTVILVGVLWLTWDSIALRLELQDWRLLPMMALLLAVACWSPIATAVSQGLKHFYRLSVAGVAGPAARLVVVALLLTPLGLTGYMAGQVAMSLTAVALLAGPIGRYLRTDIRAESYRRLLPEMARYGMPLMLAAMAVALQQTVDVWVIRQRLPAADSAGYYIAAMFGVIPMWVAPAMTPFLFPIVAERFQRGESTRRMHLQSLAVVAAIGMGIAALLLLFGDLLLSLRPAWRLHIAYAPTMWVIAVVTTIDQLMACHFVHENACHRFGYLRWMLPILFASSALLYVLMGWPVLEGRMPTSVWRAVNTAFARDLNFVMGFMLAARLACLTALGVNVVRPTKP